MPPKKKRKAKTSLEDAFSSLSKALSEREKELDAREQQLRKDREQFETEYSSGYHGATPSDVLHLNIGGKTTTALRRTLTCVPGSMLASKFSGRWDDSIEKDKDGNFYIEQNFEHFDSMLVYLRDKANGVEKYPVRSPSCKGENFYRMLEYYGMTNAIYPTKLEALCTKSSFELINTKKVNAEEWTLFELASDEHDREIMTFEVTLGKVYGLRIGWHQIDTTRWKTSRGNTFLEDIGVIKDTFALDLAQSRFLCSDKMVVVDDLPLAEGTTVRSENYGIGWYVNGDLVTPDIRKKFSNMKYRNFSSGTPIIYVKGEIEITFVELEK